MTDGARSVQPTSADPVLVKEFILGAVYRKSKSRDWLEVKRLEVKKKNGSKNCLEKNMSKLKLIDNRSFNSESSLGKLDSNI